MQTGNSSVNANDNFEIFNIPYGGGLLLRLLEGRMYINYHFFVILFYKYK